MVPEYTNGKKINYYSVMIAIIGALLTVWFSIYMKDRDRLERINDAMLIVCSRISTLEAGHTHQESRLDMQRNALEKLDHRADELQKLHLIPNGTKH